MIRCLYVLTRYINLFYLLYRAVVNEHLAHVFRQPMGDRIRIEIAARLSGQCVFVTNAGVSRRPRNPIHVHTVDDIPRDLFSFIRCGNGWTQRSTVFDALRANLYE